MKPILAILVLLAGIATLSGFVSADETKCKPGQVYDEVSGKCVTPRGS